MFKYWLRLQTPYWLIVPVFLFAVFLELSAPYRQAKPSVAASPMNVPAIEEKTTIDSLSISSNVSD
jgi:hypothetical protein